MENIGKIYLLFQLSKDDLLREKCVDCIQEVGGFSVDDICIGNPVNEEYPYYIDFGEQDYSVYQDDEDGNYYLRWRGKGANINQEYIMEDVIIAFTNIDNWHSIAIFLNTNLDVLNSNETPFTLKEVHYHNADGEELIEKSSKLGGISVEVNL